MIQQRIKALTRGYHSTETIIHPDRRTKTRLALTSKALRLKAIPFRELPGFSSGLLNVGANHIASNASTGAHPRETLTDEISRQTYFPPLYPGESRGDEGNEGLGEAMRA